MKKPTGLLIAGLFALATCGALMGFTKSNVKEAKAYASGVYLCGVDVSDHWQLYKDEDHYARYVDGVITLKNFDNTDTAYYDYIKNKKGGNNYSNAGKLDDYDINGLIYINSIQDVTIEVYGENTLTQSRRNSNQIHAGILNAKHGFTIEGKDDNASLTINSANNLGDKISAGIYLTEGGLTVKNVDIVSNGGSSSSQSVGLYGNLSGTTLQSGSLTLNGGQAGTSAGIYTNFSSTNLTVDGGTFVAKGGNGSSLSIGAYCPGTLNFNGGKSTLEGSPSKTNSYGFYWDNKGTINVGENSTRVTVSGNKAASNQTIKNAYVGKGWDNAEGTGDGVRIEKNTSGAVLSYKKVEFKKIEYVATCDSSTYDGTEQVAPLSVTPIDPASGVSITYKKQGESAYTDTIPSFKNAATHNIDFKLTSSDCPDTTGTASFVINPAELQNVSVEVTSDSFIYDGQPKQVTVSTHAQRVDGETGVSFTYSYSSYGTYTPTIPTKTDAGTYTVYWKATASNHNTATGSFEYTIGKASGTYTEPTAKELHYSGENQLLVEKGTSTEGSFIYRVGETGSLTENDPVAKNCGTYKVYYQFKGDSNHLDSEVKYVTVTIAPNNKDALVSSINEAEALYNSIAENYPEVAATLKTALDAAKVVNGNDNVTVTQIQNAVDALNYAIAKAKDDSRDTLVDNDSGVSVKTSDGTTVPSNINLSVEVKADINAEKGSSIRKAIASKLAKGDGIVKVFDVKLIKDEGGVKTEIQPSEIKEGMKLIVTINVPSDVAIEGLKVLHIHSESDIEFVENVNIENGKVQFEVSKLSEMAFVNKVPSKGLAGWAIALIIIGSILLLASLAYVVLFFVLNKWIRKEDNAIRAFKIGKKDDQVRLITYLFAIVYREESEVYDSKEEALQVKQ